MDYKEKLSGWGNNINVNSSVYLPKNNIDIINLYKPLQISSACEKSPDIFS